MEDKLDHMNNRGPVRYRQARQLLVNLQMPTSLSVS
jgi:hypothetical protein